MGVQAIDFSDMSKVVVNGEEIKKVMLRQGSGSAYEVIWEAADGWGGQPVSLDKNSGLVVVYKMAWGKMEGGFYLSTIPSANYGYVLVTKGNGGKDMPLVSNSSADSSLQDSYTAILIPTGCKKIKVSGTYLDSIRIGMRIGCAEASTFLVRETPTASSDLEREWDVSNYSGETDQYWFALNIYVGVTGDAMGSGYFKSFEISFEY